MRLGAVWVCWPCRAAQVLDQEAMPAAEALPPSLSLLTAAGGSGSPGL